MASVDIIGFYGCVGRKSHHQLGRAICDREPRSAPGKRTDTSDGTEGVFTSLTFINAAKQTAEIAF